MPALPSTRQTLLLRLRSQDGDSWTEFVEVYEQALYEFCRRRGLQDADARDVTQEVLIQVSNGIGKWDSSKGRFRSWLFRITQNIAIDRFHECARHAASGDSRVATMLANHPSPSGEGVEWEYRRAALRWAARLVRPKVTQASWEAWWLTAIEGTKPDVVARELGMSIGSVYTAKCRVFARIKSTIATLDGEPIDESYDQHRKEEIECRLKHDGPS